jgi:hypothetical protein
MIEKPKTPPDQFSAVVTALRELPELKQVDRLTLARSLAVLCRRLSVLPKTIGTTKQSAL